MVLQLSLIGTDIILFGVGEDDALWLLNVPHVLFKEDTESVAVFPSFFP